MRLYEFEGADLFRRENIRTPDFGLAASPAEARAKAAELGPPVVLKAQVLTGGRWLAGGVQVARTIGEAEAAAARILSTPLRGFPVQQIMVARQVEAVREYYLGITLDDYRGTPVAILSAQGGVAINQTAQEAPETVVRQPLSISRGLPKQQARHMCREAGLPAEEQSGVAEVLTSLYRVFANYDALVAEINPLARTADGSFVALDSKVEIDDSSLFRHPDLNLSVEGRTANPLERKGRQIGVTYVELEGDIAIIASGAGLGMASMDVISQKLRPANFLETGGAITADLLYRVMALVLEKPGIRGIFINIYGGINPIHEGAKGVVKYLQEHPVSMPIVAKALGNHQEETWEIFRANGIHVTSGVSTEEGVEELVRLLEAKR